MTKKIAVLALFGLLTACVTINIYFPAAAAQEAADQIIDDVWQIKEGEAKKVLALEATALVHGRTEAEKAQAGAKAVFGGQGNLENLSFLVQI